MHRPADVFNLDLTGRLPAPLATLCRKNRHEEALAAAGPDNPVNLREKGRILRHAQRHLEGTALLSHAYAADQQNMETAAEFALGLISIGRQEDGLVLLRHAVEQRPDLVWACIELAHMFYALGDSALALFFLDRSKALVPLQPALWFNAGQIRAQQGDLTTASDDLSRAISLHPDDPAILHEYCCLLARTGRSKEARERYKLVAPATGLSLADYRKNCMDLADLMAHAGRSDLSADLLLAVWNEQNLTGLESRIGTALLDSQQEDIALPWLIRAWTDTNNDTNRKTLQLCYALCQKPGDAIALVRNPAEFTELVAHVMERHRYDQAYALAGHALKHLAPALPQALALQTLAGNARLAAGKFTDAVSLLEQACQKDTGNDALLNNYLVALTETGQASKAVDLIQDARNSRQLTPLLLINLASALQRGSHWQESLPPLEEALQLSPDNLSAIILTLHARSRLCDWQDVDLLTNRLLTRLDEETDDRVLANIDLFALNSLPVQNMHRHKITAAHIRVRKKAIQPLPAREFPENRNRPLHVGWLSPDFRDHSLGKFMLPVINALNNNRIRHSGWSLSQLPADDITMQFEQAFDSFTDIADRSANQAARLIRDAQVDILIDLAGPTRGNRPDIITLRPASCHLHGFGYGDMTGIAGMDGLITDAVNIPVEWAHEYQEQLHYLPHSFMSGSPVMDAPEENRSAEGLPEEAIVFASFNAHAKLHPDGFALWADILHKTPNSVLWLLEGQTVTRHNLERAAEQAGLTGRLVFAEKQDWLRHRQRLALADIMLDCLYHTGGATTIDALWAGVPVITLAGETQASRVSASCLQHCKDQDLMIAQDIPDYIAKACHLAKDSNLRQRLRDQLRAERKFSPLFDPARHARSLETLFIDIAEQAC